MTSHTHTLKLRPGKVPLWAQGVMEYGQVCLRAPSALFALVPILLHHQEKIKIPSYQLSMIVYLLFPRASVFCLGIRPYSQRKSSSRRGGISSVRSEVTQGFALLRVSRHFLRQVWAASRAASPGLHPHMNSVKQWDPVRRNHTCLTAKTL